MFLNYNNSWVQKKYLSFLLDVAPNYINQGEVQHRFLKLKVKNSNIYPFSLFLKKHSLCLYKTLVDMTAYDRPGKYFRFTMVYNLLSVGYNTRIMLLTKVVEKAPIIPTIVPIFSGAVWVEREVWDLFGIFFLDNFDLRRILTDYGFVGYPLRKDFPVIGFVEITYDDSQKQIIYEPVEMAQDFRNFIFKNTWK